MPRPLNSTEMVPFDASSKALSFFEIGTLLVLFALVRFLSAALRNTHHLHTLSLAEFYILLTFSLKKPESVPYSSGRWPNIFLWRFREGSRCFSSSGFPATTSYCVINPRALSARRTLCLNSSGVCTSALDQVGVDFKDGIDLFGIVGCIVTRLQRYDPSVRVRHQCVFANRIWYVSICGQNCHASLTYRV